MACLTSSIGPAIRRMNIRCAAEQESKTVIGAARMACVSMPQRTTCGEEVAQTRHGRVQHALNCVSEEQVRIYGSSSSSFEGSGSELVLQHQYGNLRNANGQRVTQCPDGSFCCGKGPEASQCCGLGRGVFLVNSTTIPAEPSSSALVGTPSFTSYWAPPTSLSLPSATTISHGDATNGVSSPTSSPTSGTSPAQRPDHVVPIVAGILGGVIGVLILIGILFWLVRRRKKDAPRSDSMEDSVVILDTAQTTPMRQDSRRGKHPEPVHQTRRIDGTVRPPEFKGTAENDVWDRVVFIDQLGGAVRQMGF
ncbi:MAG: hypothetical protein Q9180_001878 [Flavoplaca navasiana]